MVNEIWNLLVNIRFDRVTLFLLFIVLMLVFAFLSYFNSTRKKRKILTFMLESAKDRFKTLSKINDLMLYSSSMTDVLRIIVDDIGKAFENSGAFVFTFNEAKDRMIPVVSSGVNESECDIVDISYVKHPDIFESILKKKTFEASSLMQSGLAPYSGGMFIPLIKGADVIGVLAVLTRTKLKYFIKEEKNYLENFAAQVSVILESKRLSEYGNLYKEELASVNAITEVGLMSLTTDEAMEVLINRFASITKSVAGKIYLRNQKTGELQVRARSNFKFTREDEASDQEAAEECVRSARSFTGAEGRLFLPLKIDKKAFGCLGLYRELTEEKEMRSISNLADKASIVVERSLSYESSVNIVNDLSAVSYLGNMILSTVNLDEVLNLIVRSISEIMEAKGCALRLLNEETRELEMYAAYGLSSRYLNTGNITVLDSTEGKAIDTHQIVAITDLMSEKYEYKEEAEIENINSLLCVPLIAKNRVIGVLTVFFPTKRNFTDNDKKLILIYSSQTAIAIENARLFSSWKGMYMNVIKSFADALDAKDNYTRGHSEEVTNYAMEIAAEMALSEADMELLRFSAVLHDIGKIGIDDKILKKEAKLTPDEYEIIKKHPTIAAKILENIKEFKEVTNIIVHHHERFDGKGYPSGLKNGNIPLLSRIISVVDAFEAMTSDRPYRKAMSKDSAMAELIRNKDIQFDPAIVDLFTKVLKKKNDKADK